MASDAVTIIEREAYMRQRIPKMYVKGAKHLCLFQHKLLNTRIINKEIKDGIWEMNCSSHHASFRLANISSRYGRKPLPLVITRVTITAGNQEPV